MFWLLQKGESNVENQAVEDEAIDSLCTFDLPPHSTHLVAIGAVEAQRRA